MNLPNKLSILRVLCIPVTVVLLYLNDDGCRIAAGILFSLASLTDLLDGHIARKYNLITDFGKFIDPVADKLLVLTAMIMLADIKCLKIDFSDFVDQLDALGKSKGLVIHAMHEDIFNTMHHI